MKTNRKEWSVFAFLFFLPLAGTLLVAFHIKAGWFISNTYFCFLTFIIIAALTKNSIDKRIYFSWHSIFVMVAVLLISTLLVTKETRKHFRIGRWLYITSLSLAILISCIFIYMVLSI